MIVSIKKIVNSLPQYLQNRLPKSIKIIKISHSESRRLNHVYRKKKQPTNVLSFSYGSDYGEILVCLQIIRQEARKQGNFYQYQMTWMILHGMIHLAGLHHESSRRLAKQVEQLETMVLSRLASKKNSKSKV